MVNLTLRYGEDPQTGLPRLEDPGGALSAAALEGIRRVSALPVACTMSFDMKLKTMMGVSPAKALTTIAGWGVEVSDQMAPEEYLEGIRHIPGLREGVALLGAFESPALMATAIEFVLEGLHLHQKLNKDRSGGRYAYRA